MNYIPPPVYGAATLLAIWLLQKHHPIIQTDAQWPLIGGCIIIAIGLIIDVVSILNFKSASTTINPLKPENSSSLVQRGFYSVSRNPMYLGMAIMLTGAVLIFRSLSPVVMPLVFCMVVTVMQILPEEKILEEIFGEEYRTYKLRVPRWV